MAGCARRVAHRIIPVKYVDNGRSPLILILGAILIGLALALLLFGNDLFSSPQAVELPQIPPAQGSTAVTNGNGFIEVGTIAADFSANDLDDNSISLTQFRGQPVIVNFWATWCAPCRLEMPELQATYEQYQADGLVILALNRDESPTVVKAFFYDEMGLTFTPLLDEGGVVADGYGVFNYPTTLFIDRSGVVTAVHRGPLTQSQLTDYLADTIPET